MSIDAFIKIDGVTGESVVKDHEGEIDLLAWSWGMTQSGTTHIGTGGGSGKVNVQDLTFTHRVDSSTPTMIQACCSGKHFDSALLVIQKAGEKPLAYVKLELKNVIITSVQTGSSSGEESLTEQVTLNFNELNYKYQPQDKTGAAKGGEIEAPYKIAEGA